MLLQLNIETLNLSLHLYEVKHVDRSIQPNFIKNLELLF